MSRRPGLVRRLLASTPQEWLGRLRDVRDADMLRWEACVLSAQHLVTHGA